MLILPDQKNYYSKEFNDMIIGLAALIYTTQNLNISLSIELKLQHCIQQFKKKIVESLKHFGRLQSCLELQSLV